MAKAIADLNRNPATREAAYRATPACDRACARCTIRCATAMAVRDQILREMSTLTTRLMAAEANLAALGVGKPATQH